MTVNTDKEAFLLAIGLDDETWNSADRAVALELLEGKRIIAWLEDSDGYEGFACVVLRDSEGHWYFWEGSHCSCNGFEFSGLEKSHPDAILAKDYYCAHGVEDFKAAVRAEVQP